MELTLERVVEALTAPVEPCGACKSTTRPQTDADRLLGCCRACDGSGVEHGRAVGLIERDARRWLRELAWAAREGRGR